MIEWLMRFVSQCLWMCVSSKSSEETQKKNNRLRNDETKTVKGKAICFMDEKFVFFFVFK